MNKIKDEYCKKLISMEEAASMIKPGDYVSMPPGVGEPNELCKKVAERIRAGELDDIIAENIYTFGTDNEIWSPDLEGHVKIASTFVVTANRWAYDNASIHLFLRFTEMFHAYILGGFVM
jgi:acyl-CoA hydrolase